MNPVSVASAVTSNDERLRRWRLILGGGAADGIDCRLSSQDLSMDAALAALYAIDDAGQAKSNNRKGGLGSSAPNVARWLGDIRRFFPA